ncbi:hypothetical protein BDR22DRAFT_597519 [Usnea florida]
MSFHSLSRSPVEESFFSTQEDHVSDTPSIDAPSTVMVTPNESSNSAYATADQTPMASPDLVRGTAPSTPEKVKDAPEPTKEDPIPYHHHSGTFVMNPNAPVFVPKQEDQPTMEASHSEVPEPDPGQTTTANTPPTATAPLLPTVQIFGAGHGLFYDPNIGMFTGDGPPRKSPYRADGTLPSKPDPTNDFLSKLHFPQPAEDELHIQPKHVVAQQMADFGKNGPVQTFRAGGPVPQGNQDWRRVEVLREGERGGADEGKGEQGLDSFSVNVTDEMEANARRLMGVTSEEEEEYQERCRRVGR